MNISVNMKRDLNIKDFGKQLQFHLTSLKLLAIIIGFLIIHPAGNIQAQILQRHQTITAYINNFPKHITWPDEDKYVNFHITLISNNNDVIRELSEFSKTAMINNKPIILSVFNQNNIKISDSRMIFITEDKLDMYLQVFDEIEGKPILLVSENYGDKRFTMINLYDTPERKMLFEINKDNIINQNLAIDDEILLLGGNIIDVTRLYRNSQKSLRSINKKLDSVNLILNEIQEKIKTQNNLIILQEKKITSQNGELADQEALIEEQTHFLRNQKDSMNMQIHQLSVYQGKLYKQKNDLEKGKELLAKQQKEINKMDSEIRNKTIALDQQFNTILRQRHFMYFFIIIIFLIVALGVIIFIEYRNNKKKNILLKDKKKEIEDMNEELLTYNEELYSKNEQLKDAIEKLHETQSQLIHAEKMASLGVLTAGIAHEINNPINFVYAGVNSLKKDFRDITPIINEIKKLGQNEHSTQKVIEKIEELKKEYLFDEAYDAINQTIKDIELGADRATEIIKGLRNFSRIEKEEWQLINVHDCLQDVLVLLKNRYKHSITIIKDYDNSISKLECKPGKLNQAFMNLISNAIDSIEKKGEITITTRQDSKYVSVIIKDNGKGIDHDIKSKIFDPFFTTKEVGKGVGLGLSITYGIIHEHNGNIDFKSRKGKGTEFSVHLPAKQSKN